MAAREVEESWAEFRRVWERLVDDLDDPATALLVEGERDRAALRALGLGGRILLAHRGRRVGELAQELSRDCRRLIVLTDWDSSGGEIAHGIAELLEGTTTQPDLELRRRMAKAVRGEVVHVEGLRSWALRMGERTGEPLASLSG